MLLLLVATCLFAGLAIGIFTIFAQVEERSTVRASLRQLDGYEVDNVRDRELLQPVTSRVFTPVLKSLTDLGRRFTPAGYVEKTKKKLVITGKPQAADLDRFLAVRVIT